MGRRKRSVQRIGIALIVVLLVAGYVSYAWFKPLPSNTFTATLSQVATSTPVALTWPAFGQAAVGASGYDVLAIHDAQTPLATASIIKVLTALVVLQQKPLKAGEQGPLLTLDQTDVGYYDMFAAEDGSVAAVTVGEQISEYQALQAMLLPSANNIAYSLARWAFGSLDAYNTYANTYVAKLGLTSMTVTDPSGFQSSTVASAHDLVLLGEQAMQNPIITDIVSQSDATIPVAGTVHNVNFILGKDGLVGIKTGNNDGDLGAFLFASKQTIDGTDITIIGAIMGGPDLATAMTSSLPLIESAAQNFSSRTVIAANQQAGFYQVPWQGKVTATAIKPLKFVSWAGMGATSAVHANTITAPAAKNTPVGSVTVRVMGGKTTVSSPLHLSQSVKAPNILWRLRHAL